MRFLHMVSREVLKLFQRLTWRSSKPLGFLVPYDEEIIGGDPSQRDDEADACTEGVRIQGQGDHEETGEGEQGRDEQRHLKRSKGETSHRERRAAVWVRTSVLRKSGDALWSRAPVTGAMLPHLTRHRDCIKHTPLIFFFKKIFA